MIRFFEKERFVFQVLELVACTFIPFIIHGIQIMNDCLSGALLNAHTEGFTFHYNTLNGKNRAGLSVTTALVKKNDPFCK